MFGPALGFLGEHCLGARLEDSVKLKRSRFSGGLIQSVNLLPDHQGSHTKEVQSSGVVTSSVRILPLSAPVPASGGGAAAAGGTVTLISRYGHYQVFK